MIDTRQRIMRINSQGEELGGGINHAMKRHLLEIKTLQNAPRDAAERRHWLGKRTGWDLNSTHSS
jgi:hypothetical protein